MDSLDHRLIGLLRTNARSTVATLAHKLGVSRGTVKNRITRLEDDGVITGYTVRLKPDTEPNEIRAWTSIAVEGNQMRKVNASRLDLEALIPVVEGKLPLVVEAHRASDLQALLRFAREQKLRLVLSGAEEAWLVRKEIAAAQVPVIVSALPDLPRTFDSLGATLENAALLGHAGVLLALSPREGDGHFSRTLRLEAGSVGETVEDELTHLTLR